MQPAACGTRKDFRENVNSSPSKIITLTTDFGLKDNYAGVLKGVIAGICPNVRVMDLTHGIPPHDLYGGAFSLCSGYRYFPQSTIHICIVDPGVGSGRAILAVSTEKYLFVGPDNGVLSLALAREKVKGCVRLTNTRYFLTCVSTTFHGRDIMAPVAGHLAKGVELKELGEAVKEWKTLDIPALKREDKSWEAEVIYQDVFGNLTLNIDLAQAEHLVQSDFILRIGDREVMELYENYLQIPENKCGLIVGSSGYLEIAGKMASASDMCRAGRGSKVSITFSG
jgi:S-adenosylmethionine hydrolase